VQIFVSFASEQREIAELIAVALRERSYKVFFSRDTLPTAESFDLRIERAVKASDLFVFLISPESVTRGKYTLTELSFARENWSSPSGHVLPVMIAPTEIGKIPPFLRSVSIFEPEGNVAAETAVQVDKILRKKGFRDVILAALGGIATGTLSYVVMKYWSTVLQFPFFIPVGDHGGTGVSSLPGLLFGALVAFSNWKFGIRDKFNLSVIVAFTVISWVLAFNVTEVTFDSITKYTKTTFTTSNLDNAGGTSAVGDGTTGGTPPASPVQPPGGSNSKSAVHSGPRWYDRWVDRRRRNPTRSSDCQCEDETTRDASSNHDRGNRSWPDLTSRVPAWCIWRDWLPLIVCLLAIRGGRIDYACTFDRYGVAGNMCEAPAINVMFLAD